MSSVIVENSAGFLLETMSLDGGLEAVAQQDEENIIEINGDAEIGIIGGSMGDTITTGAGGAIVFAGDGNDMIMGGNGDDIFRGGDDDDVIRSGLGDDIVIGGEGKDILRGGLGADMLNGGSGDDIFEFSAQEFEDDSMDKIMDFKDDDFADAIKIFDVGADGNVVYNSGTGMVSVNGKEAIDVGANQDITIEMNGENGTWDLI